MNLTDVFEKIAPAVVGIVKTVHDSNRGAAPPFVEFIGTGFFVSGTGVVATNRHIVDFIRGLPRNPAGAPGVAILVFGTPVPREGGYRLANVLLEIDSDFVWRQDIDESGWYGPRSLDIGFLQARAIETPWLVLRGDPGLLRPGLDVAISGFPLGENALVFGDGQQPKLRQISPLLRRGIVSSVIPAPVSHPHGFTIDIMTQGGQSGSPVVLCDEPSVVGIVSSGFDYTNWTLCEAGRFIVDHLNRFVAANDAATHDFPRLDVLLKQALNEPPLGVVWSQPPAPKTN